VIDVPHSATIWFERKECSAGRGRNCLRHSGNYGYAKY